VKDLNSKRTFLQFVNGPAVQNIADGVFQKMATPLASAEELAFQNIREPLQRDFPLFSAKGGHSTVCSLRVVESDYSSLLGSLSTRRVLQHSAIP
jgi:hypothetical protein